MNPKATTSLEAKKFSCKLQSQGMKSPQPLSSKTLLPNPGTPSRSTKGGGAIVEAPEVHYLEMIQSGSTDGVSKVSLPLGPTQIRARLGWRGLDTLCILDRWRCQESFVSYQHTQSRSQQLCQTTMHGGCTIAICSTWTKLLGEST